MLRRRLMAWQDMTDRPSSSNHTEMVRQISLTDVGVPISAGAGMVAKEFRGHLEILIRQKLIGDLLYSDLLPQYMHYLHRPSDRFAIALPPAWQKKMAGDGVLINSFLSWAKWTYLQGRYFIKGMRRTVQLLRDCQKALYAPKENYAVLMNLPLSAVPSKLGIDRERHKLVSWYSTNKLRNKDEGAIWAQVPGVANQPRGTDLWIVRHPFPRLENLRQLLAFAARSAQLIITAFAMALLGRWWAPIVLEDAVMLAYCQVLGGNNLARTYIFNNSDWTRRPLWTHFAEKCGSRIIMASYSTNMEPFTWRDGTSTPVAPGYQIMTWPNYAVWDEGQADFIRSVTKPQNVNIFVTGPIPLSDNDNDLPEIPENSVAVFDVSVFRSTNLAGLGLVTPYYDVNTVRKFLFETWEAITAADKTMVLKRKRDIGNFAHHDYINAINDLSKKSNVLVIDPSIHAERLIAKAQGVISIPYTSTYVGARLMGIPSIYYDPTRQLQCSGDELHEVKMVQNKSELRDWLVNLSNQNPVNQGRIDL